VILGTYVLEWYKSYYVEYYYAATTVHELVSFLGLEMSKYPGKVASQGVLCLVVA
jgi:hypothetical protein